MIVSLREIKAQARRDLHEAMQVPAYYYATDDGPPQQCSVRVHTKFDAKLGDLKGTSFSYAETQAQVPKLIFWLAEIDPSNMAVVMISAAEGYRVDNVHPRDGATCTAEVSILTAEERAAFQYPAGAI